MKNTNLILLSCLGLMLTVGLYFQLNKQKDYSHFKVQTQLTSNEKSYYLQITKKFNIIAQRFAYRLKETKNTDCKDLESLYEELMIQPISKEREELSSRIKTLLMPLCLDYENFFKKYPAYTHEEYRYLQSKISNSGVILEALANYEGNLANQTKNPFSKKQHEKLFKYYLKQAIEVDSNNLMVYKDRTSLKKQYCLKAVEQKHWDHIYYLTDVHGASDITDCLNPKSEYHKHCECPEAMKLAIKGWSKEHLLSSEFIIPDADPVDTVQIKKELKRAIKEAIGRDLDKEPPVSEI